MDDSLTLARRSLVVFLTITGAVSLACLARSYFRTDELVLWSNDDLTHRRSISAFSDRGRMGIRWGVFRARAGFGYFDPKDPTEPRMHLNRACFDRSSYMVLFEAPRFLEYHAKPETLFETSDITSVSVSAPVALLFSLPIPAWSLRRRAKRRAFERIGKCWKCGYDMRASLNGCPECGATRTRKRWLWRRAVRPRPAVSNAYTPLHGATQFLTEQSRARRAAAEERFTAPPRS